MPLRFPGRFLAVAGVAVASLVAAVIAVVGGLFLSPGALVAIGVVSLAAGCLAWGKSRETEPARRRFQPVESGLIAGAAAAGVVLVITGLVVLTGGPAATLIGLGTALVVGLVLAVRTGAGRRRRAAPTGKVQLLRPVSALSISDIGREWVLSTAVLRSLVDPNTRQSIVRRRQDLLDELERRDPAGFARWLAAGRPGSDPAMYLGVGPVADDRGDAAAGQDAA